MISSTWTSPEHRRSVLWVVALATIAIVFDGYDVVVYGTVLPTLLDDPTQLGQLTPATAGALGSYALIGVMIGAEPRSARSFPRQSPRTWGNQSS